MRWRVLIRVPFLLLPLLCARAAGGFGAPQAPPVKPAVGVTVWDTGRSSSAALAPSALASTNGWVALAPGMTTDSFRGDAVLSNGRVAAVLGKRSATVEVHAVKPDGAVARLRLRLLTATGEPAAHLERIALVENTKGGACLEATFKTTSGVAVVGKFRIKRGDVAVQAEPGTGARKLRIECPSRYVVLPDFFADDIILDPGRMPLDVADVPSDNMLLHLAGDGDAIAMCVFENNDQDVRVGFAGQGEKRTITGSEIDFGDGRKIWVALLEADHIWHAFRVEAAEAGSIKRLHWKMPFAAAWRCDFTRNNGLVNSWEMLLWDQAGSGSYHKPSISGSSEERLDPKDRLRWITFLGKFPYPCWIEPQGDGYVQPLKHSELKFQGPAILYPINRWRTTTPLDAYTVVDVVRNTLGVGPCEYILDLEGQKQEYKGAATCAVFDRLNGIYARQEQVTKRAEVDNTLTDALTFVTHIRGRITRYVDFGQQLRAYLGEQKQAHPEHAGFLNEMDKLAAEIDARFAARADEIKTPAHVAAMNEKFRKTLLGYEGSDAFNKCQQYTRALVVIGDNQDELSAECRWVVKNVRQQAGISMAQNPSIAPIAQEIRAKAQKVLRNPAYHEADRH